MSLELNFVAKLFVNGMIFAGFFWFVTVNTMDKRQFFYIIFLQV